MKFENLAAIRKYSGSNTARIPKNTDQFAFPFFYRDREQSDIHYDPTKDILINQSRIRV